MQRGLDTVVKQYRRKIFEEVARLGFKGNEETLKDDMEEIPYMMVNEDKGSNPLLHRLRRMLWQDSGRHLRNHA